MILEHHLILGQLQTLKEHAPFKDATLVCEFLDFSKIADTVVALGTIGSILKNSLASRMPLTDIVVSIQKALIGALGENTGYAKVNGSDVSFDFVATRSDIFKNALWCNPDGMREIYMFIHQTKMEMNGLFGALPTGSSMEIVEITEKKFKQLKEMINLMAEAFKDILGAMVGYLISRGIKV